MTDKEFNNKNNKRWESISSCDKGSTLKISADGKDVF